jgi:DNA-binding transcriptional LysR family regulator
MNGIDMRLLQAAIAVAEELSFSRAAARLHLTQPALSKQIHELERQLGVPLFERDNQGVKSTEACKVFVEESRMSVLHLERAIHRTRAVSKGAGASLNIGTSPYIDPYLVSTVLSVRLPLFPTLRIHTTSNFSPELSRQVMSRELDVALLTPGVLTPKLNVLEIARAPFYVVLRENEELARKYEIRLIDCHQRNWIFFGRHLHPLLYDTVMSHVKAEGVVPGEVHHVTTAEEAAHMVTQYNALAFYTRSGSWRIARNGLTMRPLSANELNFNTALVVRADDRTRLVSEFVRASIRKLQGDLGLKQQQLALDC